MVCHDFYGDTKVIQWWLILKFDPNDIYGDQFQYLRCKKRDCHIKLTFRLNSELLFNLVTYVFKT